MFRCLLSFPIKSGAGDAIFLLLLLFLCSCHEKEHSAVQPDSKQDSLGVVSAERQDSTHYASFPGGTAAVDRYMNKNMKWKQGERTVEGTVLVSFFVDSLGAIDNPTVVNGLCETCDAEAIRLVGEMPRWDPARKNGKQVGSELLVFVRFTLSEN